MMQNKSFISTSYGLVLDTLRFGDVKFDAARISYSSNIRFSALEPKSNVIAQLEVNMDVLYDAKGEFIHRAIHGIQKDLIGKLLHDERSRIRIRKIIFDQNCKHGTTFTHKGVEYGPYQSREDAFAAYLLIEDDDA